MEEEIVKFSDWEKIDLRVGKILDVKNHPNANKLYLLDIDLGKLGKRTLVAGLKGNYKPEELRGKLCVVFTNLEPATIRGVKSEGMILAACTESKDNIFIISTEKAIELGSKIS